MYLNSYKYFVSETKRLDIDRDNYMTSEYNKLTKEYCKDIIQLSDKSAFLYAAGPAIHHSDSRNINNTSKEGTIVVKSQLGYNAYNIARNFTNFNFDYVSINANTCASSMYCLYEAERLFNDGYTDIIIYAADAVDESQELLFSQLGIDILCSDGIVIVHLTKEITNNGIAKISNTNWVWNMDKSPMTVSEEGYYKCISKCISNIDINKIDIVKSHGSGTRVNTDAETCAINKYINKPIIEYKSKIGHTQGVSTLLEICILIEEKDIEWNTSLVLASGMGGFYGGCIIEKINK